MKRLRGFTLIELIVVVAILGSLAVIALVAINPANQLKKARDAGRKRAVRQIADALDAYVTANGVYPSPCDRTDSEGGCASATDWGAMQALVDSGNLKVLPDDPVNDGFVDVWQEDDYSVFIISETVGGVGAVAGAYYMVGAFLENENDPDAIGNMPSLPLWPNCSSGIGYDPRVFLVRSYRCPGDPPGAL